MRAIRALHGTTSKYAYGCRCGKCRAMWRAYQQAYRHVRSQSGRCIRCRAWAKTYRCPLCAEQHNQYQRARRASLKVRLAA
jgi:hypothetical protein